MSMINKSDLTPLTLSEIRQMSLDAYDELWSQAEAYGRDVKIYLHWSAGRYGQFFDDYHIVIDQDGSVYTPVDSFATHLSSTYMRNSGSVNISLMACVGASYDSNDLGENPPTDAQLDAMAQVIAVVAHALDLTIDINRVMTHGEAANNADGLTCHEPYGIGTNDPQIRWDLNFLHTGDEYGTGGDTLRGNANFYANQFYGNKE